MVAGVAVALAISMFWKISIHVACVAGSVAVLAYILGPQWLVLGVAVLAVGWARVLVRDHTKPQVVAGAAVGALVAYSAMRTLMW
jgi:membrane-associated phospholipid phosphatase